MWDNLIGRTIRRGARRLLLWNGLLLAAVAAVVGVTSLYWYNFVLGPFPLDRAALARVRDARALTRSYVTLTADRVADTGFRRYALTRDSQTHKETSRRETDRFLILMFDDQWLIARTGVDESVSDRKRTGRLVAVPADVKGQVVATLDTQLREGQLEPLPVMLETTGFRTGGWAGLAVMVPLALFAGWNVVRAAPRLIDPGRSPLARSLLRYGDSAEVAGEIEREFQAAGIERVGPATFTKNWLVCQFRSHVVLAHLGDAAWAYKAMTRHFVNGRERGTTFAGVLCDLHGGKVTVPLDEAQTDAFVVAAANRAPWIVAGYDARVERLWKTNLKEMDRIVDERRRQLVESLRTDS